MGTLEGRLGVLEGTKAKGEDLYPEVPIRESLEDLTLRANEVGTWKSCINVDHIAKERWGRPLVDADWHAFCQAIYKGIQGGDWEELNDWLQRNGAGQRGLRSHRRPKKQKPFGKMEAAKDAGEEYYDPNRKDNIFEREMKSG